MRDRDSGLGTRDSARSASDRVPSPELLTESRVPSPPPADAGTRRVPALLVQHLGVVPYAEALEYQRAVARARITGEISEDVLLLVEHPPVVTLGRSSKEKHLLAGPELLAARGIELFEVERGGDVTFHGPGQLVGYPIIDLKRHRKDLHWFLRQVEEALIVALSDFGIVAGRNEGLTGVWTGDRARKIASIGVHARDWVTWHGFALNVTTDLRYFDLMIPCGIQSVTMTSVAVECAPRSVSMTDVEESVVRAFGQVFDLAPRAATVDEIQR